MGGRPRRALLTGWFSFPDGEVTAGDELALNRVQRVLDRAGVPHDSAWSPRFRPRSLTLAEAVPAAYSHLVFVCGPLHGTPVEELHRRFRRCVRVAVGTSVVDPADPAATGFHRVLARDAPGRSPCRDLSASVPPSPRVPLVGVAFTHGQGEYGARRRHDVVAGATAAWLAGKDCARLPMDTRLAVDDWRMCATPAQFDAVLARLDLMVTDRLHGLVLALRAGVPVLAVDPVAGGAKVTAQGRACDWPAVVSAERVRPAELDTWWSWCLGEGARLARRRSLEFRNSPDEDLCTGMLDVLRDSGVVSPAR